jgi:hypothetical protein
MNTLSRVSSASLFISSPVDFATLTPSEPALVVLCVVKHNPFWLHKDGLYIATLSGDGSTVNFRSAITGAGTFESTRMLRAFSANGIAFFKRIQVVE